MKTREVHPRTGVDRLPGQQPSFPSKLDRDLTVYKEGVRWTFSNGKVLINDLDVNKLITQTHPDIAYWVGLADGLSEYRKKVSALGKDSDQFGRLDAVVEALLGKILGCLKKTYDQKMSGLSWTLQNGQLILNGINIRSFLALYRLRKTDKARKFLKGLREKLVLLMENRQESPDYDRIHDVVEELHREIEEELSSESKGEASGPARRLPPARPRLS
jgi:hypothetical protein